MSKQAGDGKVRVQSAHTTFRELRVLLGGVGMAQTVKGQRTLIVRVLNLSPVSEYGQLQGG